MLPTFHKKRLPIGQIGLFTLESQFGSLKSDAEDHIVKHEKHKLSKKVYSQLVYDKMVKYAALKGLYELDKTIGQGGFAKVKLATHIATGEKVAIKIMDKAKFGPDLVRVKLEVKAMKSLIHPHICKLYQVMETDTHFFMVMEYCSGGELFDRIVEQNRLTESESQKFFRQIVSAVAHLHSLGYAHRDLKPENVLLDKEQNLKLIDFGLCAKPKGGMQSHLSTSCGSPSYAAPELILGKQYLGAEADIWSMGVLLFTLLTGYLPFGDDSIECLYKKILSGKYVEPEWLSASSKKLVRQMLQVDPAKRITIAELCYHPWVIGDSFSPIVCKKSTSMEKDEDALKILSAVSSENTETVWKQILTSDRTDYQTATYMLLLDRKRRGLSLRISSISKPRIRQNNAELKSVTTGVQNFITTLDQSPGGKSHKKVPDRNPNVSKNLDHKDVSDTCTPGRKRSRAADEENMLSPIPHKKPNVKSKQTTTPTSNARTQDSTPGSARKVMMGLERGINRVKDCLTPKRRIKVDNVAPDQPNKLSGKNLCNVSSTSSDCPKHVLAQLRRALQHKGIVCRQKGFVLRGETEAINSENTKNPVLSSSSSRNSCKFELEVCLVEGVTDDKPLVGIRRKRLKGDAWVYKRVCEEVLALAAEDITTDQTNPDSKCLI